MKPFVGMLRGKEVYVLTMYLDGDEPVFICADKETGFITGAFARAVKFNRFLNKRDCDNKLVEWEG